MVVCAGDARAVDAESATERLEAPRPETPLDEATSTFVPSEQIIEEQAVDFPADI